jgi:hypothetical protein
MKTLGERVEWARDHIERAMEGKTRGRITEIQLENLLNVSRLTAQLQLELEQALVFDGFALLQRQAGGFVIIRISALDGAPILTITG